MYTVRPVNKGGPHCTLHRDLLLPCGFLPISEVESIPTSTKPCRPRTRSRQTVNEIANGDIESELEDDELSFTLAPHPTEETRLSYLIR